MCKSIVGYAQYILLMHPPYGRFIISSSFLISLSIDDMRVNLESEQAREVFAHFGLALYQAQCLEKQIAVLLSGPCAPTPEKLTKGRIDDLLETSLD